MKKFWKRLASARCEIVVWMSRRSASEYCGLLEILRRVDAAPVRVVDVADLGAARFGFVRSETIVNEGLFSRAAEISTTQRRRYAKEWRRLRSQNAAIRIMVDSVVTSVEIDHYDELLLSLVTDEWQRCPVVVGSVYAINDAAASAHQDLFDLLQMRLVRFIMDEVIEEQLAPTPAEPLLGWTMRDLSVRHTPRRDERRVREPVPRGTRAPRS